MSETNPVITEEITEIAKVESVAEKMSNENVLDYTRQVRMQIVNTLIGDGNIPTEKEDKSLLISALDGLDRSALGQMRIQSDSDNANKLAEATNAINHLLTTVSRDIYTTDVLVVRELPEIPNETLVLVESNLVEGELDTSYKEETVDEFKARYDQENGQVFED